MRDASRARVTACKYFAVQVPADELHVRDEGDPTGTRRVGGVALQPDEGRVRQARHASVGGRRADRARARPAARAPPSARHDLLQTVSPGFTLTDRHSPFADG